MPHVVLNGKVSIESVFGKLKPLFIRSGNSILRTLDVYFERGKNAILIECLAIDSVSKVSFLTLISGREDGVVVRLYPKIEIEKTNNVKQILAEIAKQLMQEFADLKVGETNLADYLEIK